MTSDEQIRAMLRRRADGAHREELDAVLARAMAQTVARRRPLAWRGTFGRLLAACLAVVLIGTVLAVSLGLPIQQSVSPPVARPAPSGAAARVNALFAAYPDSGPGCAVAIAAAGSVVDASGYGLVDVATGSPINPSTRFDVAGVTSEFTAAAILLLAQDRRLSLDDDIRRFLPELPPFSHPILVRELLYREVAFPDYATAMARAGFGPTSQPTDADILSVLGAGPVDFAPASSFDVDVTNEVLLRLIVERAGGMSFGQFLSGRIFGPLDMSSTVVTSSSAAPASGTAVPYVSAAAGRFTPAGVGLVVTGAGGLSTTVLDLARWANNFDTGTVGGPQFLAAQLAPGSLDGTGTYVAGLHIWQLGGRRVYVQDDASVAPGVRAALTIDPEADLAVALACNNPTVNAAQLSVAVMNAWAGAPSR